MSGLTYDAMLEAMERVDSVVRPWRHLLARCEFLPSSPFCPDGQLFVLNLDATGFGNGYRVIGTDGDVAALRKLLTEHGIAEKDHAACIVWWQLEEFGRRKSEGATS
jgi:hypothetical protein